ncbi:MAG: DUF4910 domain-containing protein [bacterium]
MPSKSDFKYTFPAEMSHRKKPMIEFISKHWKLNRSAVNPDTDKLIEGLKKEMPEGKVVEAASCSECLTWIMPQRWEVRSALLKTNSGKIIADFSDTPLTLWMHSVPYKGTVSREELLEHVVSDPDRPEDVLFHYRNGFRYGVREWGFSLPHKTILELNEPEYLVDIDSDLADGGTLKVFDAFLPGRSEETIFFMAHTCHPGMVSDGLACIAVLIELYRSIKRIENRKYSYRFLFGPEFFAAAAYLANAPENDIKNLKYGIYTDMLSNHEPIGYQSSYQGDTKIDAVIENVFNAHCPHHIKKGYRELWGNDETFYNGPGFDIPTAGIGRGMHREYHFSSDNLENVDEYHMIESLWIMQRIVDVFEKDCIPVRKYRGPMYQSRYGLYIDPVQEKRAAQIMESVQILMDGKRSLTDIAFECKADFFMIHSLAEKMRELGLIDLLSERAGE